MAEAQTALGEAFGHAEELLTAGLTKTEGLNK